MTYIYNRILYMWRSQSQEMASATVWSSQCHVAHKVLLADAAESATKDEQQASEDNLFGPDRLPEHFFKFLGRLGAMTITPERMLNLFKLSRCAARTFFMLIHINKYMRARIHTYIHTYIHIYLHSFIHSFIHTN